MMAARAAPLLLRRRTRPQRLRSGRRLRSRPPPRTTRQPTLSTLRRWGLPSLLPTFSHALLHPQPLIRPCSSSKQAQVGFSRALILALSFLSALSGLLFGYDASAINDALPLMRDHFGLSSKMEARPTCSTPSRRASAALSPVLTRPASHTTGNRREHPSSWRDRWVALRWFPGGQVRSKGPLPPGRLRLLLLLCAAAQTIVSKHAGVRDVAESREHQLRSKSSRMNLRVTQPSPRVGGAPSAAEMRRCEQRGGLRRQENAPACGGAAVTLAAAGLPFSSLRRSPSSSPPCSSASAARSLRTPPSPSAS